MASADPVLKIRREALQMRVAQVGVSKASIQASLKKTTREPKGIEIGYQAFLVSLQKQINALIRKSMPELFSILDLVRVDGQRTDGVSDDVLAAFDSLRTSIRNLSTKTDGVLRIGVQEFGNKTAAFNDAKYNDPLMNLLGIGDVSADIERSIIDGWVTENTQLVRNMNVQQLGKLETLFLRSLRDGSRSAQVIGDVAAILGPGGENINRARLIARDQIGKLDGQLTRQKQTEAGVKGYAWRGALDGRERPSHVAREGVIFQWSNPPPDGHPGQPVQCRCSAEPDLSFLGDEFAPEPPSASDFSQATPEARRATQRQQARNLARRKGRTPPAPRPEPAPTPAPPPPPPPKPTPATPAIAPPTTAPLTQQQARGQQVAADITTTRAKQRPRKRTTTETAFIKSLDARDTEVIGSWKSGVKEMRGVQSGLLESSSGRVAAGRLKPAEYADVVDKLTRMDAMAARAPAFEGRMFRGMRANNRVGKQLATEGAIIELEAWTSFTTSRKVARDFSPETSKARFETSGVYVRYAVTVKNTPVFDTRAALRRASATVTEDEFEVLAPRGAKFRVKSSKAVRKAGKLVGYNIELEEI